MGDLTGDNKTNKLSSLLGQYMSDSDTDEDQVETKSAKLSHGNDSNNPKASSESNQSSKHLQIATFWTECLDQSTGHPYYWNTETKEVTWEKPKEYIDYLNYMKSIYATLPEDSWTVGYSDGTQIPYYVNEITRVVVYEKPANFKERPALTEEPAKRTHSSSPTSSSIPKTKVEAEVARSKRRTERTRHKKSNKKPLPKHLQSTGSDDEKIEVITEYTEQAGSSSEEEGIHDKAQKKRKKAQPSLALVASYATDSDPDGENENSQSSKKPTTEKAAEESLGVNSAKASEPTAVLAQNVAPNSFASIITGGKPDNIDMDEELNKFKEELEKDMLAAAALEENQEKTKEVKEENFDGKTFQRKRRIEFNAKCSSKTVDEARTSPNHEDSNDMKHTNAFSKAKSKFISFQKSHVEFDSKDSPPEGIVYGPSPLSPTNSQEVQDTQDKTGHRSEIEDLCDVISGKVKFLSVGKAEVSPVQIMSIQLEALQSAFRASCLDSDYFFKWLKTTSDDLQTLEQHAAPEGWECKWDRENSQYCYKNLKTNETRWEFPCDNTAAATEIATTDDIPVNDKQNAVHDDDAMDICTTPPPPSPPIISSGGYQWDPGSHAISIEPSVPADISGELASFYSDIAIIDSTASNLQSEEIIGNNETKDDVKDATEEDLSLSARKAKKRKKVKVPGLASKMQEVSTMVANWQKAQRELGN